LPALSSEVLFGFRLVSWTHSWLPVVPVLLKRNTFPAFLALPTAETNDPSSETATERQPVHPERERLQAGSLALGKPAVVKQ
jgi:hypothetical protein